MSREGAKRRFRMDTVVEELRAKGIMIKSASKEGITEEAPLAYKDIDAVVDTAHGAGISQKVFKLVPLGVIKG
jgi:tRNA-splicing ligase RtcB